MNISKTNIEWLKYIALMNERPHHFSSCDELKIIIDEKIVTEFESRTHKTIGVTYESPYRIMVVDLVYDGDNYFAYERIIPAVDTGAVVIIPVYNDKFILLNQFRHSMRAHQYAFPRGFAEHNLTADENCKKELLEELGCTVKNTKFLGTTIADSGLCGDKVNVYLCEINSYEEKQGYEGISSVLELSMEDFSKYIVENKINDGFSLSAFAMYVCQNHI